MSAPHSVEYACASLQAHGLQSAYLSVTAQNHRAIRFYKTQGWRDLGSREDRPGTHNMKETFLGTSFLRNAHMTMTIDLTPEMETQLREEAAKDGLAPDRFILSTMGELLRQRRAEQNIPRLSKAESELMQEINKGLPADTWRQYHALIARRNAGTLTDEEQQVLVGLVNQVEITHARRLGYLLELANLRGTTLDAIMNALGIVKPTYV